MFIFILVVMIYVGQINLCAELFIRFERTVVCPTRTGTCEQSKRRVKKHSVVGYFIHFMI